MASIVAEPALSQTRRGAEFSLPAADQGYTEPMGAAIPAAAFVSSAPIKRISRRLARVFDSLESLPYLGVAELKDFYYFRALFDDSLERIDRKVREGRLVPLDLRGFPQELRYPRPRARGSASSSAPSIPSR